MKLLPLNFKLQNTLRVKVQFALGVLPLGIMFLSLLPMSAVLAKIQSVFGVVSNVSQAHVNSNWIMLLALCLALLTLMIAGNVLGWVANAIISKIYFGWTFAKTRAVYLNSDVPQSWFKRDAKLAPADRDMSDIWLEQRANGPVKYVLKKGVLTWGVAMFAATYLVPTLIGGKGLTVRNFFLQAAIWLVGGIMFGAATWYFGERKYRNQKAKR